MMYRRMGPKQLEKVIETVRTVAREAYQWDANNDLIYQGRAVCSLIRHKSIPNHWHLKFEWRDAPTPEFFNIINAKENARTICRRHHEETLSKPRGEV